MSQRPLPRQTSTADQARRQLNRLGPETLVRLAQSLPREQRELIEARHAEGLSFPEIARRYRLPTGRVERRLRRLEERLASPEFRFVALHLKQLPAPLRRPARLLFLHGRSLRDTARTTGKTLHRIRCQRATLQTLARAAAFGSGQ